MSSIIQVKRGTGSAVPTGLSDGELAINLDNNKLYFCTGSAVKNDFHFNTISSSGNISGSLAGTISAGSGSYHILQGDTTQDTSLYVDGTITGSSISSSGNIYATDFFDNGTNINTLYDLTPAGTYSSSLQELGNITSSNISSSGTIIADAYNLGGEAALSDSGTTLYLGNSNAWLKYQIGRQAVDQISITGAITASGNISASGIVTSTGGFTGTVNTATQGTIDHDSLANFVANEHIDHSGVSITAGAGLTGGGTIASTRDIAVGAGTGITVNANDVAIGQDVATTANVLFNHITASGNISSSGNFDLTGNANIDGNLDVDGTTNLDAVDIDGNVQLDGTFTVGVDDTGYDVTLFGATANRKAVWDASQDHLKLYDNTKLVLGTGAAAAGFDSSLYHDGSNLYLTNTTGDIILSDNTVKITAGTSGDANLILQADTDNNDEADNPFMLLEQDGGGIRSIIGHSGANDEYPDATTFTGGLSNHLIIATSGSGASRGMQFGTGNTARMTISSSGNVGIGVTDPDEKLEVSGDIKLSGDIHANGNILGDGATIISNIDKILGTTDDILEITSDSDIIYKTDDDGDEAGQHIFKERTTTLLTLDETQATFTVPVNSTFSITGNTDGTYQGDVVYFGGTTSMTTGAIYHYKSDGTWELADADDNTKSDGLLGVALGAASDTNGVLLRGMVTLDHDPGAVGEPIYLTTTAGDASSTAPSGNGNIVRIIGYCLHASNGQIWFNPDSTFVEVNA